MERDPESDQVAQSFGAGALGALLEDLALIHAPHQVDAGLLGGPGYGFGGVEAPTAGGAEDQRGFTPPRGVRAPRRGAPDNPGRVLARGIPRGGEDVHDDGPDLGREVLLEHKGTPFVRSPSPDLDGEGHRTHLVPVDPETAGRTAQPLRDVGSVGDGRRDGTESQVGQRTTFHARRGL